jgi:hypothetical protein
VKKNSCKIEEHTLILSREENLGKHKKPYQDHPRKKNRDRRRHSDEGEREKGGKGSNLREHENRGRRGS